MTQKKTAYDRQTALQSTNTKTNTHKIQNLKDKLDTSLYLEKAYQDEHFPKFMAIFSQSAYLCEEFSKKKKSLDLFDHFRREFHLYAWLPTSQIVLKTLNRRFELNWVGERILIIPSITIQILIVNLKFRPYSSLRQEKVARIISAKEKKLVKQDFARL